MSELRSKPRLQSVPTGSSGDEDARRAPPGGGRRLTLMLGVALAVFAVLLAAQLQRASRLETRVESLQGELAFARAELLDAQTALERWEVRMGEVRQQVGELAERAAALEALVAADPAAEPPPPTDEEAL